MKKRCSKCKRSKLISDFHVHPRGKFGRHPRCKTCRSAYGKIYFKRERTKILRKQAAKRYELGHGRLRRYGLTRQSYENMVQNQNGKCAICKQPAKLCVDHNHETGQVRALLCCTCNLGFGAFKENPNVISSALDYALKWRKAEGIILIPVVSRDHRFSKP